uniref:Uncharacterized protein n=1 Tax=Octactis speculum TaxID=3111310 RepID=A0A7S2BJY9_9STRA|mmetsp:Transcript_24112/g.32973  ORF Transcript_24112/g.32973 Transcript_24112/m.32973 type:complete len:122 (+) Transcript_24112:148-513(+)
MTSITTDMVGQVESQRAGEQVKVLPFNKSGRSAQVADRAIAFGMHIKWVQLDEGDDEFNPEKDTYELIVKEQTGLEIVVSGQLMAWDHPNHSRRNYKLFPGSEVLLKDTYELLDTLHVKGC